MSAPSSMTRRAALSTMTAGVATAATTPTVSAQSTPDYGGWFDGVKNFRGTADYTGQSEVTVWVGAKGNGGYFAFAPPAIRVDPGTTVTWKWTGKGTHNVVAKDGAYESKLTNEEGHTFTHTFEGSGNGVTISKYFCRPHRPLGMKGAVVVGGSGGVDPSTYETPSSASSGGGGGGGGSGGTEGSSGMPAPGAKDDSSDGPLSITGATVVLSLLAAVFSPLFFALFLVFVDDSEGRA